MQSNPGLLLEYYSLPILSIRWYRFPSFVFCMALYNHLASVWLSVKVTAIEFFFFFCRMCIWFISTILYCIHQDRVKEEKEKQKSVGNVFVCLFFFFFCWLVRPSSLRVVSEAILVTVLSPHCDAIYGFHTNNIWDFDQLYALKFWNGDSFIIIAILDLLF
jgi:hypothetical protein